MRLQTQQSHKKKNIIKYKTKPNSFYPKTSKFIQANLGNIRELKEGIESFKPKSIANYTAALTRAFEILEETKINSRGAQCNQAIMIIGDGAPENNQEVFQLHNWRDPPYRPVRVFTYLIGKEVANWDDIRWMACENQGYYVHLSDTAEVREMVLNYIPVMARPLVLGRHDHPVIWTQVYADLEVGNALGPLTKQNPKIETPSIV